MIAIDFNTLNLSKEVEDILDTFEDFTPLLKALGAAAEGIWTEKFRSEGPGWQPLAESTLDKRRKDGKGAEILKDDGKLFGSLTDAASEGAVYELNDKSLVIGTNLEYAYVHQFGVAKIRSTAKGGAWLQFIPARPFLPDEHEVVPEFERVIKKFYEKRAKQ